MNVMAPTVKQAYARWTLDDCNILTIAPPPRLLPERVDWTNRGTNTFRLPFVTDQAVGRKSLPGHSSRSSKEFGLEVSLLPASPRASSAVLNSTSSMRGEQQFGTQFVVMPPLQMRREEYNDIEDPHLQPYWQRQQQLADQQREPHHRRRGHRPRPPPSAAAAAAPRNPGRRQQNEVTLSEESDRRAIQRAWNEVLLTLRNDWITFLKRIEVAQVATLRDEAQAREVIRDHEISSWSQIRAAFANEGANILQGRIGVNNHRASNTIAFDVEGGQLWGDALMCCADVLKEEILDMAILRISLRGRCDAEARRQQVHRCVMSEEHNRTDVVDAEKKQRAELLTGLRGKPEKQHRVVETSKGCCCCT